MAPPPLSWEGPKLKSASALPGSAARFTGGVGTLVATRSKLAVTERAALIVTLHDPVPEQAPPHPANVELTWGVACRATTVPVGKFAVQLVPQSMVPACEFELT